MVFFSRSASKAKADSPLPNKQPCPSCAICRLPALTYKKISSTTTTSNKPIPSALLPSDTDFVCSRHRCVVSDCASPRSLEAKRGGWYCRYHDTPKFTDGGVAQFSLKSRFPDDEEERLQGPSVKALKYNPCRLCEDLMAKDPLNPCIRHKCAIPRCEKPRSKPNLFRDDGLYCIAHEAPNAIHRLLQDTEPITSPLASLFSFGPKSCPVCAHLAKKPLYSTSAPCARHKCEVPSGCNHAKWTDPRALGWYCQRHDDQVREKDASDGRDYGLDRTKETYTHECGGKVWGVCSRHRCTRDGCDLKRVTGPGGLDWTCLQHHWFAIEGVAKPQSDKTKEVLPGDTWAVPERRERVAEKRGPAGFRDEASAPGFINQASTTEGPR